MALDDDDNDDDGGVFRYLVCLVFLMLGGVEIGGPE